MSMLRPLSRAWLLVAIGASPSACIRAPEVVMVDRATALEEQAGGSFDDLERELTRAGITPHPVPLTPAELEALGIRAKPLVDESEQTDADRVDALLGRHCVGEGRDGLLVSTPDACRGGTDPLVASALVDRVNRARAQLWRWMHDERPDVPADELRRRWRVAHARGVVCGGWVQAEDARWEAKKC